MYYCIHERCFSIKVKETLEKIVVDQRLDSAAQNHVVQEMESALKAAHRLCLSQRVNAG